MSEPRALKKIYFMSNVNMDIIKPFLRKAYNSFFTDTEIMFSGYNQYMQDIVNPDSALYAFKPDYIILFLDGDELFGPGKNRVFFNGTDETEALVRERIDNLSALLTALKGRLDSIILVNTIVLDPCNSFSMLEYNNAGRSYSDLEHLFNRRLADITDGRTFVVDFRGLSGSLGYENLFDRRLWYIGRIRLSRRGLEELVKLYLSYLKAIEGKVRKCIVLDLDNTLWGGIIGEDGIGGIRLGRDGIGLAYVEFQEELRNLKDQGFLLAINSKNNLDDIMEVFGSHPAMVLRIDDFVSIKVNWTDKVTNMKEIADEVNIGIDSLLFIDDSEFERELVKKELPMIEVPDFPRDPAYLKGWLTGLSREFLPKIKLIREDVERTAMYKAQAQREQGMKGAQSIEDFLVSLEMKATVYENSRTLIPRMSQLTQRTNQFNLTTKRYSEAEIEAFMDRGNYVYALDVSDKFGPSGIVGLLMLDITGDSVMIDNFLLSCRVIGRDIERALIGFAIDKLRIQGLRHREIVGLYVSTKKNGMVSDLYRRLGFEMAGENRWVLELGKKYVLPDFIEIEEAVIYARQS